MNKLTFPIRIIIRISKIRSKERRKFHSAKITWINLLSQYELSLEYGKLDLEKEDDFIQTKSHESTSFLYKNYHWNIDD